MNPRHRLLGALRSVARVVGFTSLSLGATLLIWQALISGLHLNPYFAKGPREVFDLVFVGPSAAQARSLLWDASLVTFRDAALGFACGSAAAVAVAVAVVLRRGIAQSVMPVALALRSVPLVAMTPLLTLVFGQGLLTVGIVAGIVTFFPSLVNVTAGLRSVPASSRELFAAYGAHELEVLRRLQLPYALPSLFTAARIAAPGALLGAILAEWLATGQGLGYLMIDASNTSEYAVLWATIVIITLASVLVYNVVSVLERSVAEHFGIALAGAGS